MYRLVTHYAVLSVQFARIYAYVSAHIYKLATVECKFEMYLHLSLLYGWNFQSVLNTIVLIRVFDANDLHNPPRGFVQVVLQHINIVTGWAIKSPHRH